VKTPTAPTPLGSPLDGPGLSRRAFLELSAGGLVVSWYLKSPAAAYGSTSALSSVTTQSTAKNAILVFCTGAPSQVDTLDLKEGSWTPADFAPTSYGATRFPQGLLPGIAKHLGDVAIVRSLKSHALVHGLGQTWLQISRNPTGATGSIAPHMGAIAALELYGQKTASDVLPPFVALNSGTAIVGSGYLPTLYSPFSVQVATQAGQGLSSLTHPDGTGAFTRRWSDIQSIDAALRNGAPLGKADSDLVDFYSQAKVLMDAPEVNQLFAYTTADATRYGATTFGNSLLVAKQLIAGHRGARFIQVTLNGWDMHNNIYATAGNGIYTLGKTLDTALSSLIDDLKAAPGSTSGKTLFDETMVIVAGEFGRTVGSLNGQAGRDHYAVNSALLAGGGVKGGRVIGATDATGANVVDAGMPGRTELAVEDLAATVYSALGIDWTKERTDDPLHRGFEYVPYAKDGVFGPITALF